MNLRKALLAAATGTLVAGGLGAAPPARAATPAAPPAGPATTAVPAASDAHGVHRPAPPLRVSGNHLVTAWGTPFRPLGVNRSSGEFACIQGNGMWDGPADQASIDAMKTWNVHVVRIPLNEECWLGTTAVPAGGTPGAAPRPGGRPQRRRVPAGRPRLRHPVGGQRDQPDRRAALDLRRVCGRRSGL